VLGVKIDATPGRIGQASCFPLYRGVFYGQCSEICGVNHRFIPIKVEILSNSHIELLENTIKFIILKSNMFTFLDRILFF
jgi:heme/copper-type cytochrome/quinol oxidase subunit 2